jgi:gluconolactonase
MQVGAALLAAVLILGPTACLPEAQAEAKLEPDMADSQFLAPGAKWEALAEGQRFTEGPVQLRDGRWLWSDIPADTAYAWKGGKLEVHRKPTGQSNGHTLDLEGRLIACEHETRRVQRQKGDGSWEVLADRYEGKKLNSPNDVVVGLNGDIYFTDPPYGTPRGQQELDFNGVFLIREGRLTRVAADFDRPNGLVFAPGQKHLYIADTAKSHIRRFEVQPDGTLKGGEVWAKTPNPDGLRADAAGRIWSASGGGVDVISPDGKVLETIACPQQPANLAFSPDGKELVITARTGVYRIQVAVPGIAP